MAGPAPAGTTHRADPARVVVTAETGTRRIRRPAARRGGTAAGRGDRASIAEITEEADIGFGSFYNHFDSKEQLFGTASGELLEQWGRSGRSAGDLNLLDDGHDGHREQHQLQGPWLTATPSSRLGTATAMVTSLNRFSML